MSGYEFELDDVGFFKVVGRSSTTDLYKLIKAESHHHFIESAYCNVRLELGETYYGRINYVQNTFRVLRSN